MKTLEVYEHDHPDGPSSFRVVLVDERTGRRREALVEHEPLRSALAELYERRASEKSPEPKRFRESELEWARAIMQAAESSPHKPVIVPPWLYEEYRKAKALLEAPVLFVGPPAGNRHERRRAAKLSRANKP